MRLLDTLHELLADDGKGDEETPAERRAANDPLRRYADRWEETDRGMGKYVVYPPEDGPSAVRRCETREAVRQRLEHWYEDE